MHGKCYAIPRISQKRRKGPSTVDAYFPSQNSSIQLVQSKMDRYKTLARKRNHYANNGQNIRAGYDLL